MCCWGTLNTICRSSFEDCSKLKSLEFTDLFMSSIILCRSMCWHRESLFWIASVNPSTCCCRHRRSSARPNEFCAKTWIIFLLLPRFSSCLMRYLWWKDWKNQFLARKVDTHNNLQYLPTACPRKSRYPPISCASILKNSRTTLVHYWGWCHVGLWWQIHKFYFD